MVHIAHKKLLTPTSKVSMRRSNFSERTGEIIVMTNESSYCAGTTTGFKVEDATVTWYISFHFGLMTARDAFISILFMP